MLNGDKALRARLFRGDISTDDILPARVKHQFVDPTNFASQIFASHSPGFAESVQLGDVIFCDGVFGIGSSREQAVTALVAAGVVSVVAPVFGGIFFRNAWNNCLPAIQIQTCRIEEGEKIRIDVCKGIIFLQDDYLNFPPPPAMLMDALKHGGLLRAVAVSLGKTGIPCEKR